MMSKMSYFNDVQSKLKQELFEDARDICRDWLSCEPFNVQASVFYVRALMRLDLHLDATIILNDHITKHGVNISVIKNMIAALVKLARFNEAREYCLQWQALEPESLQPKIMHARMLTRMDSNELALIAWLSLLDEAPHNPEVLQGAVTVLIRLSRFTEAADFCLRWQAAAPEALQPKIMRARMLTRMDLNASALDAWLCLLDETPHNPAVLQGAVTVLVKLSRFTEAADFCLRWQAAAPEALQPKIMRARMLTRMDLNASALDAWLCLLDETPHNPAVLQGAVTVLVKLSRFTEAADFCLRWQAVAPEALQPKIMHARMLTKAGLDDEALLVWSKLFEGEPENLQIIHGKAVALLRVELYVDARKLIEYGLSRYPQDISLLQVLSQLMGILHQHSQAETIKYTIATLKSSFTSRHITNVTENVVLLDKINYEVDMLINGPDNIERINCLFDLLVKAGLTKNDIVTVINMVPQKTVHSSTFYRAYCKTVIDVFVKFDCAMLGALGDGTEVIVSPERTSNKLVIIFTGLTGKVSGFPIALVDMYFASKNISTIVVDDSSRNLFLGGIKSLGNSLQDSVEKLTEYCKGKDVYVMSNSAGGMAAIKYATLLNAKTALCFGGQTNITTSYLRSINDNRGGVIVRRLNSSFSKQLLDSKFALNHSGESLKVMLCYGELHEQDAAHANNLADTSNVFLKPLKHFGRHDAFLGAIEQGVIEQLFTEFMI
jgi:predicted Zn-dependent protease